MVSRSNNFIALADTIKFDQLFAHTHSWQATLYTAGIYTYRITGLNPYPYTFEKNAVACEIPALAQNRVSVEKGSTPACHCRSPLNLNSQHAPKAGRNKHAQGTSSICPTTDF